MRHCIGVKTKGYTVLPAVIGVLRIPQLMTRPRHRVINPPEFPTFCQGDYRSTVTLALRTGLVCPL